jgi:hypothetical protein
MQIVRCKHCGAEDEGTEVRYMAMTPEGPRPRISVRPPDAWGHRTIAGELVMFCGECRGKLASGKLRLEDA